MRTTIDVDDDLLILAKHLAADRQQSLGSVVSDLIRQGLQTPPPTRIRSNGIPVLARKPSARPVTSQAVKELLELDE